MRLIGKILHYEGSIIKGVHVFHLLIEILIKNILVSIGRMLGVIDTIKLSDFDMMVRRLVEFRRLFGSR